jgi:hypothetical protein
MNKYIVICGNPVDGFAYYGTFDTHEEAQAFADGFEETWWIKKLNVSTE